MVDQNPIKIKLRGRLMSEVCDVLPASLLSAVSESLIDGTIEGVLFREFAEGGRSKIVKPMNQVKIDSSWIFDNCSHVIFSIHNEADLDIECKRINEILGSDIAVVTNDEIQINLSKIRN